MHCRKLLERRSAGASLIFLRRCIYSLIFPPRPFYKLYRLYIIYSGDWRVVVAPFIVFLGTIGISILQSLNHGQTAYSLKN